MRPCTREIKILFDLVFVCVGLLSILLVISMKAVAGDLRALHIWPHRPPYFFFFLGGVFSTATKCAFDHSPIIYPIFSGKSVSNMNGTQDSSSAASAQRQVRVQLVSKQEDIALPENTGPILVPTGEITS